MDRKTELLLRVYVVFFLFVLAAVIIIGQVIKISVVEGEKWRNQGGKNIKWVELAGERGNIYDCRGNLLSTTIPHFDVFVDLMTPTDKLFDNHIDLLSRDLSQHFGQTSTEWKNKLVRKRDQGKRNANSGAQFFPLFKGISKDKLDLLLTFPIFNQGRYKGGLRYERINSREKPYKELCSRTIGLDRENASKVGLERTYDMLLKGDVEKKLVRRFPGDVWLPLYEPEQINRKIGAEIVTTLDMRIQDIAHQELLHTLTEGKAAGGTAIVMDVKTGAVRSIVNLGQNKNGTYSENWNYGIASASEPGSTFKLMSALVMLEDGKVDLDTEFNLNGGRKKFYDRVMRDSEMHGIGIATFQEIFERSSNVGMGLAAYKNYGKKSDWVKFYEGLEKLGITHKTGIEIFGEPKPFIKNPKLIDSERDRWSGLTVPWMAHGYELKMTPLQILNVYNTIANDGVMMKPYLTQEIMKDGKSVSRIKPQILNKQMVSPSTVLKARKLLKGVAERGTARKLKIDNVSFAGKTGTTVINYWKGNETKEYNASFAGYFPEGNPEYSVIVVVYNPKGEYYGAQVAGKVFSKIVERLSGMSNKLVSEDSSEDIAIGSHTGYNQDYDQILDYIGMDYEKRTSSKWIKINDNQDALVMEKKKISKKKVPDLKGMGLRDATYVIESLGMVAEVEGIGQVYKQSVNPGSVIKDQKIRIYLN